MYTAPVTVSGDMSVNTPPNQTRLIAPDGHSCHLRRVARIRHMLNARVELARTDPLGEETSRHVPVGRPPAIT